jgi:DNA-directed RNA polymerase subunit delta
MSNGKPKIAKDFDKLPEELISRIKLEYQMGFEDNLISYTDAKGAKVSALPFDTEEAYYLVRMTKLEAQKIIEDDEDYDGDGNLREDFGEEIEGADDTAADEEEEEDSYDQPDDSGDDDDDRD